MRNTDKTYSEFKRICKKMSLEDCSDYLYELLNEGFEVMCVPDAESEEIDEWVGAYNELRALAEQSDCVYGKYKFAQMIMQILSSLPEYDDNAYDNYITPMLTCLEEACELKSSDAMGMKAILCASNEEFAPEITEEELFDLILEAIDRGCKQPEQLLIIMYTRIAFKRIQICKIEWIEHLYRYVKMFENSSEPWLRGMPDTILSAIYSYDNGVISCDEEKHMMHLVRAAEKGNNVAMLDYGKQLLDSGDYAEEALGIRYILRGLLGDIFEPNLLKRVVMDYVFKNHCTKENFDLIEQLAEYYKDDEIGDINYIERTIPDAFMGYLYATIKQASIRTRSIEKSEMHLYRALSKNSFYAWAFSAGTTARPAILKHFAEIGYIDENAQWLGEERKRNAPVVLNPQLLETAEAEAQKLRENLFEGVESGEQYRSDAPPTRTISLVPSSGKSGEVTTEKKEKQEKQQKQQSNKIDVDAGFAKKNLKQRWKKAGTILFFAQLFFIIFSFRLIMALITFNLPAIIINAIVATVALIVMRHSVKEGMVLEKVESYLAHTVMGYEGTGNTAMSKFRRVGVLFIILILLICAFVMKSNISYVTVLVISVVFGIVYNIIYKKIWSGICKSARLAAEIVGETIAQKAKEILNSIK